MTEETVIPFSGKDYIKHKHPVFPTIRREDKFGDVGDVLTVEKDDGEDQWKMGKVEIVAKDKQYLLALSSQFLSFDTNLQTPAHAVRSIQSFYDDPIDPDEKFVIYWLKWVKKYE